MGRGKVALGIASALGFLAFVVSYSAIQKARADATRGLNLVPVVVAGVDIPQGAVVTNEMVALRSIPETFVTASLVRPDSIGAIIGQPILVPLLAGDPFAWTQFGPTREGEHLSTKVLRRGRAVTISADTVSSTGGWVRPNDHVDVVGVFKDPQSGDPVALTLLQNITVLATGEITGTTNVGLIPEAKRHYSNVSLHVLPAEAEILLLAQHLGSLALTIRNEEDSDTLNETEHSSVRTLFDRKRLGELRIERGVELIKPGSRERLKAEP